MESGKGRRRKELGKRKGEGEGKGREGRGKGDRDERESLGGQRGEGKGVGKREGRENLRGPGPQMFFPRTAPVSAVFCPFPFPVIFCSICRIVRFQQAIMLLLLFDSCSAQYVQGSNLV